MDVKSVYKESSVITYRYMILNHNIINKIFHKGWLEDIREVNEEYHLKYIYNDKSNCLLYSPYEIDGIEEMSDLLKPSDYLKPWTYFLNNSVYMRICGEDCVTIEQHSKIYGTSYIKYVKREDEIWPLYVGEDGTNRLKYMFPVPKRYNYSSGKINPIGYIDELNYDKVFAGEYEFYKRTCKKHPDYEYYKGRAE